MLSLKKKQIIQYNVKQYNWTSQKFKFILSHHVIKFLFVNSTFYMRNEWQSNDVRPIYFSILIICFWKDSCVSCLRNHNIIVTWSILTPPFINIVSLTFKCKVSIGPTTKKAVLVQLMFPLLPIFHRYFCRELWIFNFQVY